MNTSISRLLVVLCFVSVALQPTTTRAQKTNSETLLGAWSAEEEYFRPIFRFKRGDGGAITAFLTNDKSQEGNPFSSRTIRGDSIFLELAPANAQFRGALSEDGARIEGTWTQGSRTASLTFTPVGEDVASGPSRPQEPEPPYPYATEEVTFRNASDNVTLAGTLTLPKGSGPQPGVVLISGTGPQDRNAEAARHKPFLVLADHLTRHGIAVLRYDKRGVAESEGSYMSASFENLARDVAAALRFLKERPEIGEGKAGLLGLSEGGYLAPMVSERFERASFLVLLAAPSVPGRELLAGQNERALALPLDAPEAAIDSLQKVNRRIFGVVHSESDSSAAAAQVQSILRKEGVAGERLQRLTKQATAPGTQDFSRYDPQPILQQLDAPVLALYGSKDLQVPPKQNAGPMRSALETSPSDETTVRVLEGLNHMFQPAVTGHPNEYHQIETTVAPKALNILVDWIRKQVSDDE